MLLLRIFNGWIFTLAHETHTENDGLDPTKDEQGLVARVEMSE